MVTSQQHLCRRRGQSDESMDEDEDELTRNSAPTKIKLHNPTLLVEGGSELLKTKVRRTKSRIIGTDTALATSNNKTKASSATGNLQNGSLVPVPPLVNVLESASKALECVMTLAFLLLDNKGDVSSQCHGYNKDGYCRKRKIKLDRPIKKRKL